MTTLPRLHVVDGTYELYRAHYSKRPGRVAPDGLDVKGTMGVISSLFSLLADRNEAVTHIAVAFDNPIESFRNDMFEGYKTGEGMPEELVAQMDLVEEAVRALGIAVWPMAEFEADDALASAAAQFMDATQQVRILSPDKDLGQCVVGNRVVQVDRMRDKVIDADGVVQRMGVQPHQVPDFLGLVGDSADGIPGLAGFGAKSVATLLGYYDTLEEIPDDPQLWQVKVRGAPRLAQTLAGQRQQAQLYKALAVLRTDVPLPHRLDDLIWQGVPREPFERMARRLGGINIRPPRFVD